MPPKGSTYRLSANDSSAYDESTIAKQKLAAQAVLAGRGRRNGLSTLANGNASKDMVSTGDLTAQGRVQGQNLNDGGPLLDWSSMDRETLHAYRTAYRLPCPSSFKNPHAVAIFSYGIGKQSPMMARQRSKRRIVKEQLALQVRKTFNDRPVNENETVVDTLYKIRNKDRTFRMKFPAIKGKQ